MGVFTRLEQEFDYDLVEEFVGHFQYMCDAMDALCLHMDTQDGYASSVNELFRIFHNIKSASSYFNLTAIEKLSTLVESVLEDARLQSGRASEEFSIWLSLLANQYLVWLKNFEQDDEELSTINPYILKLPETITVAY
jgi:chemotaxis protein histidine kinase CheA